MKRLWRRNAVAKLGNEVEAMRAECSRTSGTLADAADRTTSCSMRSRSEAAGCASGFYNFYGSSAKVPSGTGQAPAFDRTTRGGQKPPNN
jgi:hypothetical protein